MTSYDKVYDVFLGKILEDEWGEWTEEEVKRDLNSLMEAAIPWFKFPRVSLERGQDGFVEDLSNEEIQIIATFMKCEWLNRIILTFFASFRYRMYGVQLNSYLNHQAD